MSAFGGHTFDGANNAMNKPTIDEKKQEAEKQKADQSDDTTIRCNGFFFLRKGVLDDIQNNKRELREAPELCDSNRIIGVTDSAPPLFIAFCKYGVNNNPKQIAMIHSFDKCGVFIDLITKIKYENHEIDPRLTFLSYHLKVKVTDINQSQVYLKDESIYTLKSGKEIEEDEGVLKGNWMKMPQKDYYIHYELTMQRNKFLN